MGINLEKEKEFPGDCTPDGIIVLPVNLQGIMDLNKAHRRFKWAFPEIYKAYIKDCIKGDVYSGHVKFYKQDKYEVALLFYKNYEVGRQKEVESLRLDSQMTMCIRSLFHHRPNCKKFFSAPLLDTGDMAKKVILEEANKDIEWIVLED